MAFMAKDKIVRTGTDINLATVVDLQTDATVLGTVADSVGTVAFDRSTKIAKVALGAADTGGGVISWQNPESVSILVTRIVLDVTTQSTGSCTIDIGTTATSATTPSDNLIDGISIATAGVIDNLLAATLGTNGKTAQKLASGKWVTGSKDSGAAAGTVGFAYIHYVLV